jgi:hypothetical protein
VGTATMLFYHLFNGAFGLIDLSLDEPSLWPSQST